MTDLADKIERLSAAATPGEWEIGHSLERNYIYGGGTHLTCMGSRERDYLIHDDGTPNESDTNAALIVALRNAVPELLSALRAAQHAEALATALSDASEELEYFVDFARRQCEFEGDDEAGMAVVRNARAALAAYRSVK